MTVALVYLYCAEYFLENGCIKADEVFLANFLGLLVGAVAIVHTTQGYSLLGRCYPDGLFDLWHSVWLFNLWNVVILLQIRQLDDFLIVPVRALIEEGSFLGFKEILDIPQLGKFFY